MGARAVWVLNLDAEEELAARGGYAASRAMRQILAAEAPRARAHLLSSGEAVLGEVAATGLRGRAWCPTPSALARLRAAGAVPDPAPPLEVLRRVNGRSFLHALGGDLPGSRVVAEPDDALVALRGRGGELGWHVQREHGAAGRGARSVRAGGPTEEDERWITASLRRGPLLVRPRVEVLAEHVVHGFIGPDGGFRLGVPCTQECDEHGQWRETRPSPDALDIEPAREVAVALASEGFTGPFGLDALRYRDRSGRARLAPCTDLNARFTMGWRVGMGATAG